MANYLSSAALMRQQSAPSMAIQRMAQLRPGAVRAPASPSLGAGGDRMLRQRPQPNPAVLAGGNVNPLYGRLGNVLQSMPTGGVAGPSQGQPMSRIPSAGAGKAPGAVAPMGQVKQPSGRLSTGQLMKQQQAASNAPQQLNFR